MNNKVIETINKVWREAYPGAHDVKGETSLCARITSLADDRACWLGNSKLLQGRVNKLEEKLKDE